VPELDMLLSLACLRLGTLSSLHSGHAHALEHAQGRRVIRVFKPIKNRFIIYKCG